MKGSNNVWPVYAMHAFTSWGESFARYENMILKPAKYMPRKKSQKKIRLEKRRMNGK